MDEQQTAALTELRIWNRQLANIINSGHYFDAPFADGQIPDAARMQSILLELGEAVLPLFVRLHKTHPDLFERLKLKAMLMDIKATPADMKQ